MFCKYCNADLKPEDKTCPVCEKPLNEEIISTNLNERVVEVPDSGNIGNLGEEQPIVVEEPIIQIPDTAVNEIVSDLKNQVESSIPQSQTVNVVNTDYQMSVENNTNSIVQNQSKIQSNIEENIVKAPQPTINNSVETNINLNVEKKHKNSMWIIFVIFILFLGMLGGFIFYISRSPKMIFNTLINNSYKLINNNISTNINNIKGSLSLQTNISTNDESNEIFEILNNIYIGADYEIDYQNKQSLVKLNTKYNNNELLDADVYLKDSKGYILLKDVYNKYISTDIDGFDTLFEEVKYNENHKIVIGEVKKALIKSLKIEYFTKDVIEIQINNETMTVTKNSLMLNKDNINKIEVDLLTILKNSDKFITSLSEITNKSKEQILNSIEEELDYISKASSSSNDEMVISIYTSGLMNDLVKMDLELNTEGEKTIVEFTEQSENNYSISLTSAGNTVSGTVKILENTNESITVEFSLTEPTSGAIIRMTISTSVKYNTELTNVNITNSIDASNLTEQDQTEITSKLMERKSIQDLMDAFGGLSFNSFAPDNNYNIDGEIIDDGYGYEEDIYDDFEYRFDEEIMY